MSTISVRLPNSLHKKLRELARAESTSINQMISSAVAEKLSALLTQDYLEARGQRGSRKKFDAVLQGVLDIEPPDSDRLPTTVKQRPPRKPSSRSKKP